MYVAICSYKYIAYCNEYMTHQDADYKYTITVLLY